MILISVDLPAPFSPRRACTSPGKDREMHILQRMHAAKGFGDMLHLENGLFICSSMSNSLFGTERLPNHKARTLFP